MIRLNNISKAYADKIILNQVSYHFPERERIALVGANGQGKTTLLNILTAKEEADGGSVIKPKSMRLGFLSQSPSPKPKPTILQECVAGHKIIADLQAEMDAILKQFEQEYCEESYARYESLLKAFESENGYQLEGHAKKALIGLGFREEQFDHPPAALSGGWRMRLELAKTLVGKPDFLILDEPTNHLDLPSIEWLENYLLDFVGTLVFVSHDRAFLNQLATITLHLQNGQLTPYTGNFDSFLEQKELNQQTQQSTLKKIEQQKAHMQRFVDRFRAKPSKAAQVGSRVKMIEKLQRVTMNITPAAKDPSIQPLILPITKTGKDVVRLNDLSVGYQYPLIKALSWDIHRGDKVAIVGANGLGKSTLMKTIAGIISPLQGTVKLGENVKLGYFCQNAAEELPYAQTVFQTLRERSPHLTDQTCYQILGAFLFRGNDFIKPVQVLSGGEKSRLALGCLLAQLPNLLLLDEPTNHLDMVSTEVLANLLQQMASTVIFVSHDRNFMEQVATKILEIDSKGKVTFINRK
jgi:ATP-binding cassette, subfamily F, member 3